MTMIWVRAAARQACGIGALASLLLFGKSAHANPFLGFGGGSQSNLVIDLVFWGNITASERTDVLEYVRLLCSQLNDTTGTASVLGHVANGTDGASLPEESALHYYGISGCVAGSWLNDPNPLTSDIVYLGPALPGENTFLGVVRQARNGSFGPAHRFFSDDIVADRLSSAPTHLALVITKGTNQYAIGGNLVSHPELAAGFHEVDGNAPYGAVMLDDGYGGGESPYFPQIVSHEIIEALTDTTPFGGWTSSSGFLDSYTAEACDSCLSADFSPVPFRSSTGFNIGLISQMTLDPPFEGAYFNQPYTSCQTFEPQENAPMALTLEPNRAGTYLDLFYVNALNGISELKWTTSNSLAWGPFDWGQPSSGAVFVAGRPAAVHGFGPFERRVFVRGSDDQLWMLSIPQGVAPPTWQPLGGPIFGDPTTAFSDATGQMSVYTILTDDNVYTSVITNNTSPSPLTLVGHNSFSGGVAVGSLAAFTRNASTIDLFASDRHAQLVWTAYDPATVPFDHWGYIHTGYEAACPFVYRSAPGIASPAPDQLDYLSSLGDLLVHRVSSTPDPEIGWDQYPHTPGGWGTCTNSGCTPQCELIELSTFSITDSVGSPALVSSAPGRLDAFVTDLTNTLFHLYRTSPTAQWQVESSASFPKRTDVFGSPVAISRAPGEIDVFYQTAKRDITHLNYGGVVSGWSVEANVLYGPTSASYTYSSGGSCATSCALISSTSVIGQCCTCNGVRRTYSRSPFSGNVYLCK